MKDIQSTNALELEIIVIQWGFVIHCALLVYCYFKFIAFPKTHMVISECPSHVITATAMFTKPMWNANIIPLPIKFVWPLISLEMAFIKANRMQKSQPWRIYGLDFYHRRHFLWFRNINRVRNDQRYHPKIDKSMIYHQIINRLKYPFHHHPSIHLLPSLVWSLLCRKRWAIM